jgi:D-3-phosphoglycerate dehydrogenase / 2-oxoglutarate reductase
MNNIVISTSTYDLSAQQASVDYLLQEQCELIMNPHKRRCKLPEITALLHDDVVGLIAGVEPLTREVLQQAKSLKVISRCGIGLDNVDLDAAQELGIDVFNTPEAPVMAVSELTIGLMLCLLRHVVQSHQNIQAQSWKPIMGELLSEQTVGIVGYGRIGRKVVQILNAFGCDVLIYDPLIDAGDNKRFVGMQDLLERSTIVSLHIPGGKENHHFFDEEKLKLMKPNSMLINTARGGLVDEDALHQQIKEGQLAGAALDVFEEEPYHGPLKALPNVVLTSHIGSYARESRSRMEKDAMNNLLLGLHKKGIICDLPRDIA